MRHIQLVLFGYKSGYWGLWIIPVGPYNSTSPQSLHNVTRKHAETKIMYIY